MCRQSEKKLVKQQYLLHMFSPTNLSHYCTKFTIFSELGPVTAEIGWRVWGTPANFNGFHVLGVHYCTDVTQQRSTKLCMLFGCLLGWYTIYTFLGSLPTEFCQVQNSLCIQVLHSAILAALLHGTRAVAGRPSRWALPTF